MQSLQQYAETDTYTMFEASLQNLIVVNMLYTKTLNHIIECLVNKSAVLQ